MKKILALALTLALIATLSVVSFAAIPAGNDDVTSFNTTAEDLTVNYDAYDAATEIFSIDVQWTDTAFSYNAGSQGAWNPATHAYDNAVTAGWDADDKATVTVTNHSNAGITATTTIDAADGFTFAAVADVNIDSAVGTAVAEAPSETITINPPTGTPSADAQVVASVTIAFSKTVTQG